MNWKAWGTDNCPLKVGSVIHDNMENEDILITARNLEHTNNEDNSKLVHLVMMHGIWFSGDDLLKGGNRFTYYPDWPDISVTKPCYFEEEEVKVKEKEEENYLCNQEFFNEVFKLLRKMNLTKGMYEPHDLAQDTYAWDNKAHAIIQGHLSSMLQELEDYKEEEYND